MKNLIFLILLISVGLSSKAQQRETPRILGMVKKDNALKAEIAVNYQPGDSSYSYCFVNAESQKKADMNCISFSRKGENLNRFYNSMLYFFTGSPGKGLTKELQLGSSVFVFSHAEVGGLNKVKVMLKEGAVAYFTKSEVDALFGKR